MKLPKNCTPLLIFLHNDTWYRIVERNDTYELYRVIDDTNHEFLGKGNSPPKLEEKIYSGKLK